MFYSALYDLDGASSGNVMFRRSVFFARYGISIMPRSSLKIALLSSQLNWGGGEQLLFSLGESLHQKGHQVLWIAPQASRLMERVRHAGMDCMAIAGRHPSPLAILRIRRALQKNKIDVLHGNDAHAISWGSLLAMGQESIKLFGVKHTVFQVRSPAKYNWAVNRMICVSRAVRDVCIDGGILESRLAVVHGGIHPPELDRLTERQRACRALGIGIEMPLFCAVGSLISCKGYDTLIEAADNLRQRIGEFKLVICGDGAMRTKLQEMIDVRNLNQHVQLLGFCEDPTSWIAAADVFVHPTRSEGLSLVTIAAQMVGTPIVATEVGGLREVIRCQYTSRPLGWIFASRDPKDLAELLENALNDFEKRKQFIRDAQQSAIRHFNLDQMVNGFLQIYTDCSEEATRDVSNVPLRMA